jgi:hypothetical protein
MSEETFYVHGYGDRSAGIPSFNAKMTLSDGSKEFTKMDIEVIKEFLIDFYDIRDNGTVWTQAQQDYFEDKERKYFESVCEKE